MSTVNAISPDKLARLIGTFRSPAVIDVRSDEKYAADPRLIPGSIRRNHRSASEWGKSFSGRLAIVVCQRGTTFSQGAAAWFRHSGVPADILEGGFEAWRIAGRPLVPQDKLPPRDEEGRTIWVTRTRPEGDRVACPWLIRRFIDPAATFLFVAPVEVVSVAESYGGAPFDIENVFWSHRGETGAFDTMVEEFRLDLEPLRRLAIIVRGADTGRPDLVPEAAGLLAASLGLSRMYADDLEQLEAGVALYDLFYRWRRDVTDESHNWPSGSPKGAR